MKQSYGERVVTLKPNEVFIFGSNEHGFHGAGAAGFASFGRTGNVWREEGYGDKPYGWRGKWNVKGIAEGLQEGTDGKSYALPTVVQAGQKCSLTKLQIIINIKRMYKVAQDHSELTFLVAGSDDGKIPLNGYSHKDMVLMYSAAGPIPTNVLFSDSYTKMIGEFP